MSSGGMLKFFNDKGGRDSEHGETLHWPGTPAGFPYRGATPPLAKQSELDEIPHVLDFHSRQFRMWEPQDKADFDSIRDRIENGWYIQRKRDDRWIESQQHYIIWLEWVQIYGEDASGKNPRMQHGPSTLQLRPADPKRDGEPFAEDGFDLSQHFG